MDSDDQACRWRDVAAELTGKQVQYLEKLERRHGRNEALLLPIAREYAQSNLAERVLIGHVVEPPGATFVGGWEQDGAGEWFRDFDGESWSVGSVQVIICGRQSSDGRIFRNVSVYGAEDGMSELNAAELRQLITVLKDAEKLLETPSDQRPRQCGVPGHRNRVSHDIGIA
ncbi:hypothetical protein, partial [Mycolicibacterium sp.]|uniref:hypothetical protein n=1 Tax=Mycolicibacterium sp. TaxID=2320850 RepID=UPI0025F06E36